MRRRGPRSQTNPSYLESSEEENVNDETYESDVASSSPVRARRSSPSALSTRASNRSRLISMKDPSTDEDSESDSHDSVDDDAPETLMELPPPPKRRRVVTHRTRAVATRTREKKAQTTPKRAKPTKKERPAKKREFIETDGVSPPWSTLPYHVLLSVFDFAWAQRLHEYPRNHSSNTSWLMNASLTCKAFAEPALAALYRSPILKTSWQLTRFNILVTSPSPNHFINYNAKVKRLDLDERMFGNNFDVMDLFNSFPTLAHINLDSDKDRALRGHANVIGEKYWKYPPNLYDTLSNFNLKSWQWNTAMFPSSDSNRSSILILAHDLHLPFSKIENLHFVNLFTINSLWSPVLPVFNESERALIPPEWLLPREANNSMNSIFWEQTSRYLAESLKSSTNLKSLRLDFAGFPLFSWMESMPSTLTTLHFHNCDGLESNKLSDYLLASCSGSLEVLVFDHNQNLNLDFLVHLKSACPKLKELSMNLILFSQHRFAQSVKPGYETLLHRDFTPTWPTSLIRLELNHLQKLEKENAEVLFNSLICSATDLPQLRYLHLAASVDIDFRNRASFRDVWTELFARIFKRQSPPPRKELASFKAYRLYLESEKTGPTTKRSKHRISNASTASDDGTRLRPRKSVNYDDSEEERDQSLKGRLFATLGGKQKEEETRDEYPVQGMCETVRVRIDNMRPGDKDLTERDFLDQEDQDSADDSDFAL
jgi:hypothetical protein